MPGGHEHQRDVIQKDLLIPLEPYTQCGVVVLIVSIRFQVETVLPFVSDVRRNLFSVVSVVFLLRPLIPALGQIIVRINSIEFTIYIGIELEYNTYHSLLYKITCAPVVLIYK